MRFGDVLERMHALSKASTLGLLLVMLGGVVGIHNVNDLTFVALAAALQVITSPVGANLIARATYRASNIRPRVDSVDELADAHLDDVDRNGDSHATGTDRQRHWIA